MTNELSLRISATNSHTRVDGKQFVFFLSTYNNNSNNGNMMVNTCKEYSTQLGMDLILILKDG